MAVEPENKEELTLYGLFSIFFNNWKILTFCGFFAATVALVWAINQPNVYTAKTVVMPASDENMGLAGLAGNLGGLAAMAGVNLPEGQANKSKLAVEVLKTQAFLGDFIEEQGIKVAIMAANGWEPQKDELLINEKKYDVSTNKWVRKVDFPRSTEPSIQETYEEFKKLIKVEIEPKTKFVTIELDFYSPILAADWLEKLVLKINEDMRLRDKQEAQESIEQLAKLSKNSNVQGLSSTFASLMEEQIKTLMLTEVRKDYVFKVIEPPVVPELKSKPKRAIIIVVAGFVGGVIGIIIVLFRSGRSAHIAKTRRINSSEVDCK